MKICYVAPDVAVPHFRGASTHVYELARHLVYRGHRVHLLSRRVNLHQPKTEVLDGIAVHRIGRGIVAPLPISSYLDLKAGDRSGSGFIGKAYGWYLFTLFAFHSGIAVARIVKKYGIDVILERETSFGAGAVASLLTSRPLVLEVIGPRYSRYSLRLAKKVVAYTRSMIQEPIQPSRLELVTAAVNTELFRPDPKGGRDTRMAHGVQNSPIVGYVGTFAKWHGVEDIVAASVKVIHRIPEARFLMVGPYFEDAKRAAQEKGVMQAFTFTGAIPYKDIPRHINAADVLVAPYDPSKSKLRKRYGIGSPLKVFEYMACGKPVIASSVEPVNNVVENEKTGILVPPGDPDALADVIICLLENPSVAGEMGKMALERVRSRFSWRAFTDHLEQVLVSALDHR